MAMGDEGRDRLEPIGCCDLGSNFPQHPSTQYREACNLLRFGDPEARTHDAALTETCDHGGQLGQRSNETMQEFATGFRLLLIERGAITGEVHLIPGEALW